MPANTQDSLMLVKTIDNPGLCHQCERYHAVVKCPKCGEVWNVDLYGLAVAQFTSCPYCNLQFNCYICSDQE